MLANKITVLVDQDGPLAAFDTRLYERAEERGWEMDCTVDTQCRRFSTDCILNPDHYEEARKLIEETDYFRDLPVVEGAVEGIHELAEKADVWICTKPLEANRNCRDDKAAWIERHLGYEWLERLILAPNKGMVRGDILLDDAIKMSWLPYAEWEPVVYPMPWNGQGSEWDGLRSWRWGDPVENLIG